MSVIFSSHRFRDPNRPVPEARPVGPPDAPELLGQRLIDAGLLEPEDLSRALDLQSGEDCRLGDILLAQGMVDETALAKGLSAQSDLPVLSRLDARPDVKIARTLDMNDCLDFGFLPLRRLDGRDENPPGARTRGGLVERGRRSGGLLRERAVAGSEAPSSGGMVPRGGIEPPTPRFSVACSTN